jgi:hypothetical protein
LAVRSVENGGRQPRLRQHKDSECMTSEIKPDRMTRNSQKQRTPAEVRAGNKRLGFILLAVAAVFFLAVVVDQYVRSRG